ncbi:MAG TPA: hypothetical protein VGA08_02190 [Candidatus Saccharimonadales bacterium]
MSILSELPRILRRNFSKAVVVMAVVIALLLVISRLNPFGFVAGIPGAFADTMDGIFGERTVDDTELVHLSVVALGTNQEFGESWFLAHAAGRQTWYKGGTEAERILLEHGFYLATATVPAENVTVTASDGDLSVTLIPAFKQATVWSEPLSRNPKAANAVGFLQWVGQIGGADTSDATARREMKIAAESRVFDNQDLMVLAQCSAAWTIDSLLSEVLAQAEIEAQVTYTGVYFDRCNDLLAQDNPDGYDRDGDGIVDVSVPAGGHRAPDIDLGVVYDGREDL